MKFEIPLSSPIGQGLKKWKVWKFPPIGQDNLEGDWSFFYLFPKKKGEFLGKLLNLPTGLDFGWGSQRGNKINFPINGREFASTIFITQKGKRVNFPINGGEFLSTIFITQKGKRVNFPVNSSLHNYPFNPGVEFYQNIVGDGVEILGKLADIVENYYLFFKSPFHYH